MTATEFIKGQRFTIKSGQSKGKTGEIAGLPVGTGRVPVLIDGGSGYVVFVAQSVIKIEAQA